MVQIVLDNTVKKYIYKKRGESANSVGNMYWTCSMSHNICLK